MSYTPSTAHSTPLLSHPHPPGIHLRHLLTSSSPDTNTYAGTASPANTSEPFTPPPLYPPSPYHPPTSAASALEFDDLIDSRQVLMTPPTRPGLVHAASYAYGSGEYNSTSQERSTASTSSPRVEHAGQPQWTAKTEHPGPGTPLQQQSFTTTSMLPPMRTAAPPTGGYWQSPSFSPSHHPYQYQHHAQVPPHPSAQHQHPHQQMHQPHTAPAPIQGFASMAQHPQYPGAPSYLTGHYPSKPYAYPNYGHHHPQQQYGQYSPHQAHAAHPSSTPTSSSTHTSLYTPPSAPYTVNGGTIQPSAFSSWSHGSQETGGSRLMDRRQSVSSVSEKDEARYDVKPSPAMSTVLSPDSDGESAATATAPGPAAASTAGENRTLVQNGIEYTTDAEVKQSPQLKRMCYNCETKAPPSWRKSIMNPGRILCNKCGIYERTHHRARPPQGDELKLRKTGSSGYRREAPPPLSVRPGPVSPSSSLYSSVPSQATPSSTTAFTFPPSQGQQQQQHQSMPPVSASAAVHSTHAASPSSFHPAATHRRFSQATNAHSPAFGGSSSPYALAYARRGASYQTTPIMGLRGVGGSMGMPGGAAFYDQGRRHSDATVHPPPVVPLAAPMTASNSAGEPVSANGGGGGVDGSSQTSSPLQEA